MRNLLLMILLSVSLHAQCFGTHPAGTLPANLGARCSPFGSGTVGPWVTTAAPLSIGGAGNVRLYFSDVPFTAATSSVMPAAMNWSIDLRPTPALLSGGCFLWVDGGALSFAGVVFNVTGCQTMGVLSWPPLPELVGVPMHTQGFVMDTNSGDWAASNVSIVTLQS